MIKKLRCISLCALALLLAATSVITGSLLSDGQASFAKTQTDSFNLSVDVGTRRDPIYSIDAFHYTIESLTRLDVCFNHMSQVTAEAAAGAGTTVEKCQQLVSCNMSADGKTATLSPTGQDCYIVPVATFRQGMDGLDTMLLPDVVYLRYKTNCPHNEGQIFAGSSDSRFSEASSVRFNYVNDGKWHLMKIDLSSCSDLTGYTSYIRWDFFADGALALNYSIDVQMLAWFYSDADAEEYSRKMFGDDLKVEEAKRYGASLPQGTSNYPQGAWGAKINTESTTTAVRFASCIDAINGTTLSTGLISYFNTKEDGSYNPVRASIDGLQTLSIDGKSQLVFAGWAIARGGQDTYYWSLDGNTWYSAIPGVNITLADAEPGVIEAALYYMQQGTTATVITSPSYGRFGDWHIDLSDYKGKKVTVYLAVDNGTTNNSEWPTIILTATNVTVS